MDSVREDLGPCLNFATNQIDTLVSIGQNENKVGLEAHLSTALLILNNYNSSSLIQDRIYCAPYPRKRFSSAIDSDRMPIA